MERPLPWLPAVDPTGSENGVTVEPKGPADPVSSGPCTSRALDRDRPVLGRVRWAAFGLQLAGLLAFSTFQYARYALTKDFAGYAQAWWAIGRGHLDPWSTAFGIRFWRNNAEFAMWALSLLYHLSPHPVVLLWVQDVVVVATELVAFGWIAAYLGRSRLSRRAAALVAAGSLVALLLDPWVYETIAFDFHVEVFAALFVVLAGRDLWAGRRRRLWIWVPLALASEALGGAYVIGVGISGVLAGKRTRATGLLLITAGLGWMLLLGALGGDGFGGRGIDLWYGYLVGPHAVHVGVLGILAGVLRHPDLVAHMIALRWVVVAEFLAVAGIVGVASPWGFGPALVVFVPNILNADPDFVRILQSFQSWPAIPFVLVGSVMVLVGATTAPGIRREVAIAGAVTWALVLFEATAIVLPTVPKYWIAVSAPAAAELAAIRRETPVGTEVVASNGVIGRFGLRPYVYPLGYSPRTAAYGSLRPIPVKSSTVLFIITSRQGVGELSHAETMAALSYVEKRLHARLLADRYGIYVLKWSPPRGTTEIF